MSLSAAEDDPESYESSRSEDDWEEPVEKKTTRRRTTKKSAKKPKISSDVEEEEEEEEEEDEDESSDESTSDTKTPNESKKGVARKKKSPSKKNGQKIISSKKFAIGSFVIAKKDAKVGDPTKHPWIWKIDGKCLLQKFEPFEDDGKIRHKNTFIYSGWSPMETDDYAPLTVDVIENNDGDTVVELHWDELKKIVHNDSE